MRLSVAIPTYSMNGSGVEMLRRSFDALSKQSFKDFEVIISDNSEDDFIFDLCKEYMPKIPIFYFRNPDKGMATNTNFAMGLCQGEIIKILYQDDYLAHEDSLKLISDSFKGNWLATGCIHKKDILSDPHYPSYNAEIYKGNNTIGSPSVLTIRNEDIIYFDEKMTWLLDCDYYARMYKKHGNPDFLFDLNVVMGIHKNQVTNMLADSIKRSELDYMLKKFQ
jgi:glycosyltransferase involved in cell wall biosynthesis